MPSSSFQVEWLLTRLRQWQGKTDMVRRGQNSEKVELTAEGFQKALEHAQARPALPPENRPEVWPLDLADKTPYPSLVHLELERRAVSFMDPPPLEQPALSLIPRVELKRRVKKV